MPVVHFIKKFVAVPSTWDGWAMRVMTISVVLVLASAWILFQRTEQLSEQLNVGRAERNAFQREQTERTCVILRKQLTDANTLKGLGC